MKFVSFLRDKILHLLFFFFLILYTVLLLRLLKVNVYSIVLITSLSVFAFAALLIFDFLKERRFYNRVLKELEKLDKKFLLSEIIERPNFQEGELFYEILKTASKSMNDEIAKYRLSSEEYREYIETWVHEIKTPIASSKLIIENNRNEVTESIDEEIDKIEGFVEQSLFYSKSGNPEKDYIVKRAELKSIVNSVIRKNSKAFIESKTAVKIEDVDYIVFTDTKWAEFIINQIVINAVKYGGENPEVKIYGEQGENKISLYICDNGIGIPERDIDKVFDKGFTGENGRRFSKSTGIGLYLCKKLCDKLGLGISIKSKAGEGTAVRLVFPKSKMTFAD